VGRGGAVGHQLQPLGLQQRHAPLGRVCALLGGHQVLPQLPLVRLCALLGQHQRAPELALVGLHRHQLLLTALADALQLVLCPLLRGLGLAQAAAQHGRLLALVQQLALHAAQLRLRTGWRIWKGRR